MKTLLVTGGAGFIGSAFCKIAVHRGFKIICLDALTYAGNIGNVEQLFGEKFEFVKGDIRDFVLLEQIFSGREVSAIVHFAAESHVDNSIQGPRVFVDTNVVGTLQLLEISRKYCRDRRDFRFIHISTDEVFGDLGAEGRFTERSPYAPNSPYSATKAASDHLVRAWNRTYGVPTIITNCSNNYGPRQHREKLIPRMIHQALLGQPLPVYDRGENIRDWIHVEDHCEGILLALAEGRIGSTYCFGGNSERRNIDVVKTICRILDEKVPRRNDLSYAELIRFVEDRPGHDFRYAIDDSLAKSELGFKQKHSFETGLTQTIDWYLASLKPTADTHAMQEAL